MKTVSIKHTYHFTAAIEIQGMIIGTPDGIFIHMS